TVKQNTQKQIAELQKKYNDLYKRDKFQDALAVAYQIRDLDPENPTVFPMISVVQTRIDLEEATGRRNNRDRGDDRQLGQAEETGPVEQVINNGGIYRSPHAWETRVKDRKAINPYLKLHSSMDREIKDRLDVPCSLHFQNMPLREAIND